MRKYIGIPYMDRGRDFGGCDCYGLVWLYNKLEIGTDLPTLLNTYGCADDPGGTSVFIAIEKKRWNQVEEPSHGDVLLFKVGRFVSHVGVFLQGNEFLHVLRGRNSAVERLDNWLSELKGVYRWTT